MLKVSINGAPPVPADSIVMFDDDAPIAAAVQHGEVVFYCDSIRDTSEFAGVLRRLGITRTRLPTVGPEIVGNVK